ncbi:MAG: flippase [Snowella sp.]|nr:flippase [Snowella sp.]
MLKKLLSLGQNLNAGSKKIATNLSWLMLERLLAMTISLLINLYVIRYLGPNLFGKFSYATSYISLFEAITKLGLDSIVIRNLVFKESLTNEVLGTAFVLKFLASLFTIFLASASIIFINDQLEIQILVWIISLSLIFSAFDVIDFWFQSKVLSGYMAVIRSLQLIASSIIKIIFINLKMPVFAFAWLVCVDGFLKVIGMIYSYLKNYQNLLSWKIKRDQIKLLLKDSCPLILSSIMVTLYVKIDQVMLGNMSSAKAVGDYAAAIRFSEVWYFIPIIICSSVFPSILRAKQRNQEEYYRRLQQLYDLMGWLSFLIGLFITLSADFLVNKLLGTEFRQATSILVLHIWAAPFVFLGVARGQWFMAENLTKFSFATTVLGAITNIILNLILIPLYSGNGAAIATLISYGISAYLSCIFYPVLYNTFWMLTKALLIPFRVQQNILYYKQLRHRLKL